MGVPLNHPFQGDFPLQTLHSGYTPIYGNPLQRPKPRSELSESRQHKWLQEPGGSISRTWRSGKPPSDWEDRTEGRQMVPMHRSSIYLSISISVYICIYIHTSIHACIALHCIALHCIASHRIASHRIASHDMTLHYITLHYITLHYITHIHTYNYVNAYMVVRYIPWCSC